MSRKRVQDCGSPSVSETSSSDSEAVAEDILDVDDDDVPCELFHQEVDRPLAGHLRRHQIKPASETIQCRNVHRFIAASKPLLRELLSDMLVELRGFKYQLRLRIDFHKAANPGTTADAYFAHRQTMLLTNDALERSLSSCFAEMVANVEAFEQRGSGWVITSISHMDVHVARYRPLLGSSYIDLPLCLANSKAIINPQNHDDEKCFLYCVLAAMYPHQLNPQRISSWNSKLNNLKCDCLSFPVSLGQIPTFERDNTLSINVYGFDNKDRQLYPIYISQMDVEETIAPTMHVNLLLLSEECKQHYCLVKNLDRLLHTQTGGKYHKYFCRRCLSSFKTRTSLCTHMEYCRTLKTAQRIKMPKMVQYDVGNGNKQEKPPILKFKEHHKTFRQCLILYGDFECILEKLDAPQPSPSTSYITKVQKHTPCGFAIQPVFKCCSKTDTIIENPVVYRGPDAVEQFLEVCIARAEEYQHACDGRHRKINMNSKDWKMFHDTLNCQICGENFDTFDADSMQIGTQCRQDKCRDHCHFCSKYRAAVHSKCNLKNKTNRNVLVAMHNSRRYDTHLIMQKLGVAANQRGFKLDVIAKSSEDYISFSLIIKHDHPRLKQKGSGGKPFVFTWRLRFLDTFQFLPSGLDNLVRNLLTKGRQHFNVLNKKFPDTTLSNLLLRKGVYPYSYMDSWLRFYETQLPPIESFYNDLSLTALTVEDYAHAEIVFQTFKLNNLGEYHDLYLLSDTLLLADVFEGFRQFGLDNYDLDPAHYFTLPSFGWAALLKLSKVQLELLTDSEMYRFVESGIRGGISVISHRYGKANNPYVPNFNPVEPCNYIFYLDANNLYGWTMVHPLPTRSFRWMDENEIASFDIKTLDANPNMGYVLEVDMDYPKDLHDMHNCYPLAPEKLMLTVDQLSPYCRQLSKEVPKTTKLIQTLSPKLNYIVHHQNLLLYLRLGLKLTKIHRVLQFEQTTWMKDYIEFNTEMRKKAQSNFDKDLFKLLNNSVFGKSMENVREYVDLKLTSDEEKFLQLVADPRYEESVVFDNELIAVKLKKVTVTLNKPIYVGFTVLERSKHLMYSFHYDNIVAEYGDRAKLLFSDTDSLCYLVQTNDIYDDMERNIDLYDTSDYPTTHRLFRTANKKVMGKMKDETNSVAIEEFVGLRPKMYSLKFGGIEKKTAKGVSKAVVKKRLRHDDYVGVLENRNKLRHNMFTLRNEMHHMYTMELRKISLSAYDDKRFLTENGIDSFAYGHYKILLDQ